MKYFRSTVAVYVSICQQLDAAYGYPNTATKTMRSLPLPGDLPTDSDGLVYLAIDAYYCDFILPSQMLPDLLASGLVEEVTPQQYEALLPPSLARR